MKKLILVNVCLFFLLGVFVFHRYWKHKVLQRDLHTDEVICEALKPDLCATHTGDSGVQELSECLPSESDDYSEVQEEPQQEEPQEVISTKQLLSVNIEEVEAKEEEQELGHEFVDLEDKEEIFEQEQVEQLKAIETELVPTVVLCQEQSEPDQEILLAIEKDVKELEAVFVEEEQQIEVALKELEIEALKQEIKDAKIELVKELGVASLQKEEDLKAEAKVAAGDLRALDTIFGYASQASEKCVVEQLKENLQVVVLNRKEIGAITASIDTVGKVEKMQEVKKEAAVESRYAPPKEPAESSSVCDTDRNEEECWWEHMQKPSILFLGNLYNHALVEGFLDRRWVVSASYHHALEFDGFNSCGADVPLSCMLFGKFRIMDIFLLSKLSYDNKLYFDDLIPASCPRVQLNGREAQYLAYLAPFNVCVDAERREKWIDFGALYRFGLGKEDCVVCSVGFNVPVRSCTHIMSLDLEGVDPRNHGFTGGEDGDIQFVLGDFQKHFVDVMDFFNRVVLGPKDLNFSERQHKVGVGDISLFTFFDLNRLTDKFDGLQVGLDLVFPSGNKSKGCEVWEVILGNGGAFQLGFSANALFKTATNYFNPSIGLGGKVSFEFESCRRVPKLKMNNSDKEVFAIDVKDLLVPVFSSHKVRSFAEYDSCVHYFADQIARTKTKLGGLALFSIGNYFYNVFREAFRLAFFYDFLYKTRDNVYVCDKDGIYNTCGLEECTQMHANQISWHLAYVSKAGIEVNAGTKHVLGGKNFPKTHSLFASLIANF